MKIIQVPIVISIKIFCEKNIIRGKVVNYNMGNFIYLGDARITLQQLVKEKHSFDIIFLDADKNSHLHYYKVIIFYFIRRDLSINVTVK